MISITEIFDDSKQLLNSITTFIDKYIGYSVLRKCRISKIVDKVLESPDFDYADSPLSRLIGNVKKSAFLEKCISAKQLLTDKILLCFAATSAYRMFQTDTFYGDYQKDTFYRFDLMPQANWERLQTETAYNVISEMESVASDDHTNVLIFDDSLYNRTGGKGTDLAAKVFDHNDRKMRTGFRMMTGGWSNGDAYIPFSQCLLTTRDEKLMVGVDKKVDGRTTRGKRRAEAKEKGTTVVLHMVQKAKDTGIPFDYVLFDTWFSHPSQLVALKKIGADTIAMIKKNSTKYIYTDPRTGESQKLDVNEIYSRNKKRRGRSKYLLSINVIAIDSEGGAIPVKLVYARNHSNRKQWVCFICTDMEQDEESILRIYSYRWKCEVYFKLCKSYLKLRTECHSPSYDAITSHMVVVAIRYMILAVERFHNTDNRTIEELFYGVQREIIAEIMDAAIVLIIDTLLDSVRQCFHATEEQINELVCVFIEKLPSSWQKRFRLPAEA